MSSWIHHIAPPLPEARLAELAGGDLVVRPTYEGRRAVVAFRSPYELFLSIDGRAVMTRPDRADRRPLMKVCRQLPALYATLEERFALVLNEDRGGELTAVDLFDRQAECYLSHDALLSRTERLQLGRPPFAFLGAPGHEGELRRTLEGFDAMGPSLELRLIEDDRVVHRCSYARARALTR